MSPTVPFIKTGCFSVQFSFHKSVLNRFRLNRSIRMRRMTDFMPFTVSADSFKKQCISHNVFSFFGKCSPFQHRARFNFQQTHCRRVISFDLFGASAAHVIRILRFGAVWAGLANGITCRHNFDIGIRFKFTNYSVHIINKLFTVSALPIIQNAKHMMRA